MQAHKGNERKLIKILYVDPTVDEKSSSKMLEDSTAHLSHTCVFTVVPNAFIALECYEHTGFQLIIAKKDLIDLHAVDMMKILDAVGATIPVVVLIERGEEYNLAEMQGLRLYLDVLRRPFCTADLCRVIQAAVDEMENPRLKPPHSQNNESKSLMTNSAIVPSPKMPHPNSGSGKQRSHSQPQQQQPPPPQQQPPSKRAATGQPHSQVPNGMSSNNPNSQTSMKSVLHPASSMNSFNNNVAMMTGPYKSYGNAPAAFPPQDLLQYDMGIVDNNQNSRNMFGHAMNHGSNNSTSHAHQQLMQQHQQHFQQAPSSHQQQNHPSRNLHHENTSLNSHHNNVNTRNQGNAGGGNRVIMGNKTEELLRWKECIQVYSQELNASLSGMFQNVIANDSAGNHLQQSQQQQHRGRAPSNTHQSYDHHQAALGIAALGQINMMNNPYAMYHQAPQQGNDFNTMMLQHMNNHSSSDEGGTSTSSSVEDFGGNNGTRGSNSSSSSHVNSTYHHGSLSSSNNGGSSRAQPKNAQGESSKPKKRSTSEN